MKFKRGLSQGEEGWFPRLYSQEFEMEQKGILEINLKRLREEIAMDLCTPDNNNTHTQNNTRVPTHFYKQIYMPAMVR
jgi:hypothetical protein